MSWVSTYPQVIAALAQKNGRYDATTPKLSPSDMVAVMGLYGGSIVSALRGHTDGLYVYGSVGSDGRVLYDYAPQIPADVYTFASVPSSAIAWRRQPQHDNPFFRSYEPGRKGNLLRSDQLEQVAFTRQMIDDYQKALDAITLALHAYPYGGTCARDFCASFLSKVRALGGDLDVLAESPPTTFSADVRGALGVALNASTTAAGELAAKIGNVAGEVVGNVAGGFFGAASLTTLVVAGLVGYVALKKYGV